MKRIKKILITSMILMLFLSAAACKNTNSKEVDVTDLPASNQSINKNKEKDYKKDYIKISYSKAILDKEHVLDAAEIIVHGKISKKLSEVMINPDGTRKTALGEVAANEQITEYEVEIYDVYKGDYTQNTINVKTSNGQGLSPDLILHGEDDNSVLSTPLDRFDLDVGQECILLICNRSEFGREGIDEALGYVVSLGSSGYYLPDGNGNYVCNAGQDINCFTLNPDTIKAEIKSAGTVSNVINNSISDGAVEYNVISSIYEYTPAEELEQLADLIIVGKYTGQSNQIIPDKELTNDTMNVYTDYIFEPVSVIKGNANDDFKVRMAGGKLDNVIYYASDNPELKSGETYLLYLMDAPSITENDTESYFLVMGEYSCMEINDDNKIDNNNLKAEDIQKIQELYESAK